MKTFRSSRLPRIFACPASRESPELLVRGSEDFGALGTAAHNAVSTAIRESLEGPPDLRPLAREHDLDLSSLRFLAWRAFKLWQGVQGKYGLEVLAVERQLERKVDLESRVTGRSDIITRTPEGELVILDFKTGYLEHDFSHQLTSYLWLAQAEYDSIGSGWTVILWVRPGEEEPAHLSRGEMISWEGDLRRVLSSREFRPGEVCCWCPRAHECAARHAAVQGYAQEIMPFAETLPEITPARVAELWPRYTVLQNACKRYRAVARGLVQEHGSLPIGDGRELALVEQNPRTINLVKGWRALVRWLGGTAGRLPRNVALLADCLKVEVDNFFKLVSAKAKSGEKGAARKAAEEELVQMDALVRKVVPKLTVRKIRKEAEDDKGGD